MTGFGRASGEVLGRRCVVEVRSVNHRFLDLKLRLSPPWLDPAVEQLLTQAVRRRIDRGSLVLTVRDEGPTPNEAVVRLDVNLARAYATALREVAQMLGVALSGPDGGAALVALVAAQPGVLVQGELDSDPETRFRLLDPIVDQALAALIESRQREGEALAEDLCRRIQLLSQILSEVARLVEGAPEMHRRRLEERICRLMDGGTPIDPQRLAQEVALLADRLDVTEEITRLRAHMAEFTRLCQSESVAGRRLDFLTQEMNREVNTISAKAQSAEVAFRIVAMKSELERLREQIQNVE
ncbi:MAG: YicC/YloC family endoribonuclease [Myxococcales bacterium]|nr:YicC family protein [Myxococcota bacterium]MDW8283093.1 YicC/YloC family endoribonuclease [Myxococcales bacterium]